MSGGNGDDVQDGGAGNDTIYAGAGRDVSTGGDGDDVLTARARVDLTPGPGGATDIVGHALDGGNGEDVFRTRDGEADRITCGPATDRALLDEVDVITDATAADPNGSCEQVRRKAPRENATDRVVHAK
jgi:Ca2+-binding RTX toxin-like protein